jgi:phage gp46-like protein
MAGNIDAVLSHDDETGLFDFQLDELGGILTDDFLDTAILYSIYGERRADVSEVTESHLRRGSINNEFRDYENGSKLWLYEQARLTRTVLNNIEFETRTALQWLVDDGLASAITEVVATVQSGRVLLNVIILRINSRIYKKSFDLWENTGLRG